MYIHITVLEPERTLLQVPCVPEGPVKTISSRIGGNALERGDLRRIRWGGSQADPALIQRIFIYLHMDMCASSTTQMTHYSPIIFII